MEDKKYELVEDNFIIHEGRKLYRIRALKEIDPFGALKTTRGNLGGFVEGYHNLSQEGNSWIYHEAKVYGNARVENDAIVGGDAEVFDNARVKDEARVYEYAKVYGNAVIKSGAKIGWHSNIYGNVIVRGFADVLDDVKVYGNAEVYGSVAVGGYTKVYDNAKVHGNIEIIAGAKNVFANNSNSMYQVEGTGSICNNAEVYGINNIRMIINLHEKVSGNSIIRHNEK
jgi:carbonic anhydrase/acetyltransferase-like protein (isoleucine patch superfamily)